MKYEDYLKEGIIQTLAKSEYDRYINFHNNAYKDDLNTANKLSTLSPRWIIISGYYAMHDITKLYLGKKYGLKISERMVHSAAIAALRKVLEDKKEREKAIKLLEDAKRIYDLFESRLKEKILPTILKKGRSEREKAQYYQADYSRIMFDKALFFLEGIVKPYIKLIEDMLK